MKVSELIRVGAELRPQFMGPGMTGDDGELCVLGLAYLAKTGQATEWTSVAAEELFPVDPIINWPAEIGSDQMKDLSSITWTLNDHFKWPAAKIADWLESIGF